jgi:hypothetical protein
VITPSSSSTSQACRRCASAIRAAISSTVGASVSNEIAVSRT